MASKNVKKGVQGISMLIGTVMRHVSEKNKRTICVRAKTLEMDTFLTMYFKKRVEVLADDPDEKCEIGDHVVVKLLENPIRAGVAHQVQEIVYKLGAHVEPFTGRKCSGPVYLKEELPDPRETLEKYGVKYVPSDEPRKMVT